MTFSIQVIASQVEFIGMSTSTERYMFDGHPAASSEAHMFPQKNININMKCTLGESLGVSSLGWLHILAILNPICETKMVRNPTVNLITLQA